jgi:hypothetical protein
MDIVQNYDGCINMPSSQIDRSLFPELYVDYSYSQERNK